MAEDSIKASEPDSRLMAKLAELLREAPDAVAKSKYMPPALRAMGAMDPFDLKSAGSELENQAYGNMPLQAPMPNMGERIPHVKKGRGESMAALAGIAPVGVGSKSILLPFHISSNLNDPMRVTTAFKPMVKALREDPNLMTHGQTKLWQDYGMAEIPRGKFARPRENENGRFMYEVPDIAVELNPDIFKGRGAIAGQYKLADILNHPQLYKVDPELKNVDVGITPRINAGGGSMFLDFDSKGGPKPTVNLSTSSGTNDSHKGMLLHELQHVVQTEHGMPKGANPSVMEIDPDTHRMLASILTNGRADGALKNTVGKFLNRNEYERYRDILGEQQAVAVERRSGMRPEHARDTSPILQYDDPQMGLQYGTVDALKQLGQKTRGSTEPLSPEALDKLVRMLRQTQ